MEGTLKEQLARSMFRFKKVGITFPPGLDVHMGEFVVMNGIAENTSDSDNNVCVADIQNSLYITKPAISQMFNALEKKGYIIREVDTKDRRKVKVKLTPKGEEILKFMKDYSNNRLCETISRFGEENTKQLIELFNRFADISEDLKQESLQEDKRVEEHND